jgi:hypothetical protein
MSEEDTILGGTPAVSFDDAAEFLLQRSPNPCPSCGYTKWKLSAPTPSKQGGLVSPGVVGVRMTDGIATSQGIPFVLTTCRKCAFVKMHGVFEISVWKSKGKPEFKEDE